MLLPVILIFFAILSAAVATYGTFPQWMTHDHGLQIIEITRRVQWPLLTVSVACCFILFVLVLAGKKKVWWLIGFAPVIALFLQLFVTGTVSNMQIIEEPVTVPPDGARFLRDEDYVVGVIFAQKAYALPYRQLFNAPVVILDDREKRAAIFWSPYANCAMAFNVNRQFKARELDIVSMPANALLIYNSRVGQFINGVTGLTSNGERPTGLGARIPAATMTWQAWRTLHPQTLVTQISTISTALPVPLQPQFPMRVKTEVPAETPVVFFRTAPPAAMAEDQIGRQPLNVEMGGVPVLLYRDAVTGQVKGFERIFADRTSRFILNPSKRRAAKGVVLLDVTTNSGWTENGVAVDGDEEIVGQKLTPITNFDEHLYFGVMKNWYPDLELITPGGAH